MSVFAHQLHTCRTALGEPTHASLRAVPIVTDSSRNTLPKKAAEFAHFKGVNTYHVVSSRSGKPVNSLEREKAAKEAHVRSSCGK